jgi:hypothetical protein
VPVVPALRVLARLGPAGLTALALALTARFHLPLAALLLLLLLLLLLPPLAILTVLVDLVGHSHLQSCGAH